MYGRADSESEDEDDAMDTFKFMKTSRIGAQALYYVACGKLGCVFSKCFPQPFEDLVVRVLKLLRLGFIQRSILQYQSGISFLRDDVRTLQISAQWKVLSQVLAKIT